jgi:hypothetical protein
MVVMWGWRRRWGRRGTVVGLPSLNVRKQPLPLVEESPYCTDGHERLRSSSSARRPVPSTRLHSASAAR